MVFPLRYTKIRCIEKVVEQNNNLELNVWSPYLFALKSPVTREKYKTRLDNFLNFIGLEGRTTEEKRSTFIEN